MAECLRPVESRLPVRRLATTVDLLVLRCLAGAPRADPPQTIRSVALRDREDLVGRQMD
jgi:hypothetical protein